MFIVYRPAMMTVNLEQVMNRDLAQSAGQFGFIWWCNYSIAAGPPAMFRDGGTAIPLTPPSCAHNPTLIWSSSTLPALV